LKWWHVNKNQSNTHITRNVADESVRKWKVRKCAYLNSVALRLICIIRHEYQTTIIMLFPLNKENVYLCAIMLTQSEKRVKKYKRPISIRKSQFNMMIIWPYYVDIVFYQFLAFKYFSGKLNWPKLCMCFNNRKL